MVPVFNVQMGHITISLLNNVWAVLWKIVYTVEGYIRMVKVVNGVMKIQFMMVHSVCRLRILFLIA